MPWTLEPVDQDQVLQLTYSGILSPETSIGMTDATLARVKETGVLRVLLEFSHAQIEIPITNIYKLPDRYDAAGVPRNVRVAVVVPKNSYKLELFEFYEDVCRNRGYFVQLFTDAGDARAWLKQQAEQR